MSFSLKDKNKLQSLWAKRKTESAVKRPKKKEENPINNDHQPKKTRKESSEPVIDDVDRSQKLSEASRKQLAFSFFRSLNQTLYTSASEEATSVMDEENFEKYHEAYSEIVNKWPVKPAHHLIKKVQGLFGKNPAGKVLADMGCGDKPMIAEAFPSCTVYSFDLVSKDERITPCNLSKIPLKNESVDVVIFSLSLMGKDLNRILHEGTRILREGGHLYIAEVASRFEPDEGEQTDTLESLSSKLRKHFHVKKRGVEKLPPNNFFVVLHFVKSGTDHAETKKKDLPEIHLKACQYKPR